MVGVARLPATVQDRQHTLALAGARLAPGTFKIVRSTSEGGWS
jgi:hypothetical protein